MKRFNLIAALFAAAMMMMPVSASAGNSSSYEQSSKTCRTPNGSLCPPTQVHEKIVPEYFNVPTKKKHIYYTKPNIAPVTTHIIHHVPTPVYGGQVIVEKVQGGQWTGPSIGCCNGRPVQPSQPVYCRVHQTTHQHGPTCRR